MKTLTYAAVALAVIAGAAAMAQSFQPFAVQAASPTEASDLNGGRGCCCRATAKTVK
jgi:hypothetical protein